ncbi:clan AA aspartic protease, TIGR02281 family [Nitrosomonas sp. PY1]|nr:clan AA aspartic protease, TIGR02281 family [Nitrosomonas sp. PY1]
MKEKPLQDRGHYRVNPTSKNDRGNRKSSTSSLPDLSWKRFFGITLVWVFIGLVFLVIFQRYQSLLELNSQTAQYADSKKLIPQACGLLPPNGATYLFDPLAINRTDVLYSGLRIENKHDHPMVAILFDSANAKKLLALSIATGNSSQIAVPVGQYGMQVLLGSSWCNLETGFSDGATVTVEGGISVNADATTSMQFSGSGIRPVRLDLAYNMLPIDLQHLEQPLEVIGNGKLDLQQTRDGHYFSSGTVNGVPVVFMIDTGATVVSVSAEIASRAGIQKCTNQKMTTANGIVSACKAIVPEVTFGEFRLTNVEVMVMPNLPGNPLLGMNVLRNFHLEQVDRTMRISTR